ncbi:MAG: hypothetical protein HUU35_01675 [Armatimonadetes bacterium]|nr:hypothetical protein [Armatimonadota bacterium]
MVVARRCRFVAADGSRSVAAVLRTHDFAGVPATRLDVTLLNDQTKPEFLRLRSLEAVVDGVTGPVTVGLNQTIGLAAGQRVLQREDFEYVVEPSGAKGKRLDGVVEWPAGRVVVRNFWEQYPAAVAVDQAGLRLGLYPALPDGFYAGRKDEDKFYFHVRTGLYEFRQGFAKTHELWLDRSGSEAGRSLAGDPPTASAPPEYVEATGAFRGLAVAGRAQFPGFDERIKGIADGYLKERDQAREYGVMNFGDWYGERTWNWGNLEYDLGHALLDQYARSGYAPLYHRATEILRHQGDVDTRHYADDPRRIGQQWIHSVGHTAGYYPPDYKDMKIYASPGWSDNRGHIWSQGLFQHYLMGGDRRSFETARLIADWAAGPQTTNFTFGLAREPGWMLILVMGAYNATEDPYYLNGAKLMVRKARELAEASGNRGFLYHKLYPGHCDCDVPHSGEAGFMLAVQMTGMKMYYERTGEEQVAEDIVKIARFIVETMWEPDSLAFRYTSCPQTSVGASSTYILLEGLAFAALRANDARLAEVTREALATAWSGLPASGKSAGYALCALPQGLDTFSRLPGPSFAERQAVLQEWLRSPARRGLPALVPNGDFETDAQGYYARGGVQLAHETSDVHSGRGALRLVGKGSGQNEYLVTRYDTSNDPYELTWLKAGESYRLTAWLKVIRAAEGTPAPSIRLTHRDGRGSRDASTTNTYDLNRLGTWQKLSVDLKVPDYNTRNYLALNTNTRGAFEAEMLLDDISLVPLAVATADTYHYLRLEPAAAALAGGARLLTERKTPWLIDGTVSWTFSLPAPAGERVWLKLDEGGRAVPRLNGRALAALPAPANGGWVALPEAALRAGENELSIALDGARLGRVVVTNDPTTP